MAIQILMCSSEVNPINTQLRANIPCGPGCGMGLSTLSKNNNTREITIEFYTSSISRRFNQCVYVYKQRSSQCSRVLYFMNCRRGLFIGLMQFNQPL